MVNFEKGDVVRYIKIERRVVATGPLVESMPHVGEKELLYPKGHTGLPFVHLADSDKYPEYEVELVEKAPKPKYNIGDWVVVSASGTAYPKGTVYQITGLTYVPNSKRFGDFYYTGEDHEAGVWQDYLALTEEPNTTPADIEALPRGTVFARDKDNEQKYVRTAKGGKSLSRGAYNYALQDFWSWDSLYVFYNPEKED